jgi:hypothetical protein
MLMPAKAMPFQPWAMFTAFSPPVIKQAGFMRFLSGNTVVVKQGKLEFTIPTQTAAFVTKSRPTQ